MTKEILLTTGHVALVDDEDCDWLTQWKWSANPRPHTVYAQRRQVQNHIATTIYMHQQIMQPPHGLEVDHADGNGLNNTRGNLRLCNRQQQEWNRRAQRRGISGYKGVHWDKNSKLWRVGLVANGVYYSAGYFRNAVDGALAYNQLAIAIHGEFARLNVIA